MKKHSLNFKFLLVVLLLLTALFVVMLTAVQIVAQIFTNDYMQKDIVDTHKTLNSQVTDILNEVNFGYTRLAQSEMLLFGNSYSANCEAFAKAVGNAALADYVNVVLVVDEDYYCLDGSLDLPAKSFIKQIAEGSNILYLGQATPQYLQLGRKFQHTINNINGYIVFYLDAELFNGLCSVTDAAAGYTQILTDNYQVLANSNGQNVGLSIVEREHLPLHSTLYTTKVDGVSCFVAVTPLTNQYNLGWNFVSVLKSSVLKKDFITLSWVLAIIAAVCVAGAIVAIIQIARKTTAPINKLSQKISAVDQQKRSFEIGAEGDELYELEKNYQEMLQRLFKLMDENKENMETQRKLEMDALQMQINPHFLYNTLDAIAWMAKIKRQPEIETLVINLAKFFRISLHKGDKYVKVVEETELIEHFLEIEKIRFPNTINYICDLEEGVGEYKTLKLILQPIVENSIKHGFAGRSGVGTIKITARTQGDDIVIDVADDGCGFDVTPDFWTVKTDNPNGFGLYNVHERIRLEYGEGYGLSITSQKDVGTTVQVRIKKRL